MSRRRATLVAAVVVAVVLVAVAGLSLRALRSPPIPTAAWASGTAVVRDPDSTVYIAPSGILFDLDSAALNREAIPALRTIAADIDKSHLNGTIRVEGYTDDAGTEDYNLALSRHRAQTVAAWLVDDAGMDRSRVRVIAFGESSPAQPNDSDAHRQANRRVVIAVER